MWQRIVARGLQNTYPDPTQALLLDPALELLPPSLLRYFDQTRPDAACPPVAVTDVAGCTRAPGCGSAGPDVRWQNVTIGDLLAHSAGLPYSAPPWEDTVTDAAALRGLTEQSDFSDEHALVRATTPYQAQLDSARQYLANKAGTNVNNVFFINPWNRANAAGHPVDEVLTKVAGRCLMPNPQNKPAWPWGQSDTNSMGSGGYSNTSFAFLERVITHLKPGMRFAAYDGEPNTQGNTVLQQFLANEGIATGVQHQYAMFPRHKLVMNPGGPQRREWSQSQLTGGSGDGFVWTLFRNGAIARGRSYDLADDTYWTSPHANPIP